MQPLAEGMTLPREGLEVGEVLRLTEAALTIAGCVSAAAEAELAIRRLTGADPSDRGSLLAGGDLAAVDAYVEGRRSGEPPHHILGGGEFMGRWIVLDRATYIPRPWTAEMVVRAIAILKRVRRPRTVVDLGTGSGAIAVTIAAAVRNCHVWALDIDPASVECARINTACTPGVRVLRSDLFTAMPGELVRRVDLVIGSLPYVPTSELAQLPRDYREREPRRALDGGQDGLAVDGRALGEARGWLRPGSRMLLELGHRQGGPLAAEATRLGYTRALVRTDEDGDDLFLECTL